MDSYHIDFVTGFVVVVVVKIYVIVIHVAIHNNFSILHEYAWHYIYFIFPD